MFKIYEFADLKDKKLQDNKNLKLLLFVEVHTQSVPHVPAGYNCRDYVLASYNCREHVPATYNCRNTFLLVITVGNTFPLVITVGNTFPLVITVRNRFLLVITVENTFPLVITVGKNNGSSFVAHLKCHLWVVKKRGTSEMSSMVHRNMYGL